MQTTQKVYDVLVANPNGLTREQIGEILKVPGQAVQSPLSTLQKKKVITLTLPPGRTRGGTYKIVPGAELKLRKYGENKQPQSKSKSQAKRLAVQQSKPDRKLAALDAAIDQLLEALTDVRDNVVSDKDLETLSRLRRMKEGGLL